MVTAVAEKLNLSPKEIAEFKRAAVHMYLPYNSELDINPQDDSFLSKKKWDLSETPKDKFPLLLNFHPLYLYRHQVCKQADTVFAHFILEDAQKYSTIKNSYIYYENITTHDSSLSCCIFSIMASYLGMVDKAYDYFYESSKMDLLDTHQNTKDGVHTANLAGSYMAIVFGFGGLRIKKDGIYLAPVLPKQWTSFEFKLHDKDSLIDVSVNDEYCIITLLQGSEHEIHIYNDSYLLSNQLSVPLRKAGWRQ